MIRLELCPSCRRGRHGDHVESREAGTVVCPCEGACRSLVSSIAMEDLAREDSRIDLAE